MMKTLKNEREKYNYLLSTKDCCRCSPVCGGVRYAKANLVSRAPSFDFWKRGGMYEISVYVIRDIWSVICDMWSMIPQERRQSKAYRGVDSLKNKRIDMMHSNEIKQRRPLRPEGKEKKPSNQLVFCNLRATEKFFAIFQTRMLQTHLSNAQAWIKAHFFWQ